jgi:branched-chain amino acid transport system ATP-binding protein
VLEVGQIMFSDTGKALLGDDRVRKAYLGAD